MKFSDNVCFDNNAFISFFLSDLHFDKPIILEDSPKRYSTSGYYPHKLDDHEGQ